MAVAIPGGVLAQRFGDKRIVLMALAAMTLGGLMMASGDATLLTAGRILSGCGAVVLNVLVTKMTTDTFEGREVVTALGVLITSWPLGIATGAGDATAARDGDVVARRDARRSRPERRRLRACRGRLSLAAKAAGAAPLRFGLARRELALAVLAGRCGPSTTWPSSSCSPSVRCG